MNDGMIRFMISVVSVVMISVVSRVMDRFSGSDRCWNGRSRLVKVNEKRFLALVLSGRMTRFVGKNGLMESHIPRNGNLFSQNVKHNSTLHMWLES